MKHVTLATRCTIQQANGDFCDAPMAYGAPYPICPKHAGKVSAWVKDVIAAADVQALRDEGTLDSVPYWPTVNPERMARRDRNVVAGHRTRGVYYVRVGELIKVGFSENVARRLCEYPPDSELLAVESGDRRLEKRRHAQFADALAYPFEWFQPSAGLMAHIQTIKALPADAA